MERRSICTKQRGVTSQKTAIFTGMLFVLDLIKVLLLIQKLLEAGPTHRCVCDDTARGSTTLKKIRLKLRKD